MKFEELDRELRKGEIRPAYLIAGVEPLLRDESLAAIRRTVLGKAPVDFNFDTFEARSIRSGQLLDALRSLPVMAERRMVLLRGVRAKGKKDEDAEEEKGGDAVSKLLLPALEALRGGEISSVLIVMAEKLDRRAKWVKAFSDPACVVECNAPTRNREIAAFARVEAHRQGVKLGEGAPELLAEAVGAQLMVIRREIEKLALLAEEGMAVSRADVTRLVTHVADEPMWQLSDAISEGRADAALKTLSRLLAAGMPAPVILAALANHFRKLLRVREGENLPGSAFVQRKFSNQVKRYSLSRLRVCLSGIHESDEILKGRGGIRPEAALERLVIGLSA